MKTIIFSDTHLTASFNPKQFNFLKKIISGVDQVIIAGDFWEARLITFDTFLNSKWSRLFPLLKKKNTVYLFGNHDKKRFNDNRVDLFSDVQTEMYKFTSGKHTFTVEHGNRFSLKIYFFAFSKLGKFILHNKIVIKWIHAKAEEIFIKTFGKNILQILYGHYNKEIKKKTQGVFGKNEILITGHTHAAEIDLKNNYVNTGIIRHGIGQYVLIEGNKITLKEESY